MATSDSVNFSLTRNELIRQALLLNQGIDPQETVDVQQQNDGAIMLNMLVKRVTMERPLWGMTDYTVPLYDSKESYTIGSGGNKNVNRPLQIVQARRLDSDGIEVELEQDSRIEYMALPDKDTTGQVNIFYYDPQLSLGKLHVWPVTETASTSLSDGATDDWTVSATATEYYYTGTDITAEPPFVFISNSGTMVEMTEGTVGSLSQYEYAWDDNDALGDDTLYVWSATDPDATSGSVIVLTTTPDRLRFTVSRPLEDFDTATDNPDFPQEAYLMLVYNLAYLLAPAYNPARISYLKPMADEQMNLYLSSDTEPVGLTIHPRKY